MTPNGMVHFRAKRLSIQRSGPEASRACRLPQKAPNSPWAMRKNRVESAQDAQGSTKTSGCGSHLNMRMPMLPICFATRQQGGRAGDCGWLWVQPKFGLAFQGSGRHLSFEGPRTETRLTKQRWHTKSGTTQKNKIYITKAHAQSATPHRHWKLEPYCCRVSVTSFPVCPCFPEALKPQLLGKSSRSAREKGQRFLLNWNRVENLSSWNER